MPIYARNRWPKLHVPHHFDTRISCDFVIHIAHAYTMYGGDVSRHHRSQFSLTHMGPSILAAAFTTFMAAVVMVSRHLDVYSGHLSLVKLCKLTKTPPARQHADLHRDYLFPEVCRHPVHDDSALNDRLLRRLLGLVRLLWTRRAHENILRHQNQDWRPCTPCCTEIVAVFTRYIYL